MPLSLQNMIYWAFHVKFLFGAPLAVDVLVVFIYVSSISGPTLVVVALRRRAAASRAHQAELARSWAAHVRGDTPSEPQGVGEWSVWPPRLPRS